MLTRNSTFSGSISTGQIVTIEFQSDGAPMVQWCESKWTSIVSPERFGPSKTEDEQRAFVKEFIRQLDARITEYLKGG
jgi:hypothetical protein